MGKGGRLVSLDVMRGLTIAAMLVVNNPGSWSHVYAPLLHAEWNGLTPTDLIYPFFTFIMGVSMCFSLGKDSFAPTRAKILKTLKRCVLLFLTGFALQCFSRACAGTFDFATLRIMGVLQGLAVSYLLAAAILMAARGRHILPAAALILVSYMVTLHLGNGYELSPSNIIARVDRAILGEGHLYVMNAGGVRTAFEPESLLSCLPRAAEVLLGVHVGKILVSGNSREDSVRDILLFGAALAVTAFLLRYLDPINKSIWSASFTLATSGAASLVLALLVWAIDVKGRTALCGFFMVFGSNPLFLYCVCWILSVLLGLGFGLSGNAVSLKSLYYSKCLLPWAGPYFASLLSALTMMLLTWLAGLPLYRKKIFIKL